MKSPRIPVLLTLWMSLVAALAAWQMNERFSYPDGTLGPPWTTGGLSGNSRILVGPSREFGGYRPDGRQVEFVRPATSDGAAWAARSLPGYQVAAGQRVKMVSHFSYSNISNTQAFCLRLKTGLHRILSLRVCGKGTNAAHLEYEDVSGSYQSLALAARHPLKPDNWYRLEAIASIAADGAVSLDLALFDMSQGGWKIHTEKNLAARSVDAAAMGGEVSFLSGYSAGCPTYRLAGLFVGESSDTTLLPPYAKERFAYPEGPLGAPWSVHNASGSSSVTVGDSGFFGGYRPDGGHAIFSRPSTSDGAVSATLATGSNPGTTVWKVAEGERVKLVCHFSFTQILSTQSFLIRLRQGTSTVARFRVCGNPAPDTAILQYDSNGADPGAFLPLPGEAPVLRKSRWYRLEATIEVVDLRGGHPVLLDIALHDMSDGGTRIYSGTGIVASHADAIDPASSNTTLHSGIAAGRPVYALAGLSLLPVVADEAGTELLVTEFGAVPETGEDTAADLPLPDSRNDTPAVLAALAAARNFPSPVVVFPPGRYDFAEAAAGASGIVEVRNLDSLCLRGEDAELVGRGLKALFNIRNCKNLKVQGLRVDWAPLPFTAGVVVFATENYCDVQIAPGHPLREAPVEMIQAVHPPNGNPAQETERPFAKFGNVLYYLLSQKGMNAPAAQVVGEGRLRMYRANPGLPAMPLAGSHVVAYYHVRGGGAFQVFSCGNVEFNDVRVYAAPGMGFMVNNCEHWGVVRLENCQVVRKPGSTRWKTTTADASHFNMNRGRVELMDCLFEDMGDDGCNVHAAYSMVHDRVDGRTVLLRGWTNPFLGSNLESVMESPSGQFRLDDELEFSEQERRHAPAFSSRIKSVRSESVFDSETNVAHTLKRVEMEKDLPGHVGAGTIVANASEVAAFRMKNCLVRRNRGQGIRVKTRDALVEHCRFEDTHGNGVWVLCDADVGHESIATDRVTIRECFFRKNTRAVRSSAGREDFDPDIHKNLVIEGCRIEQCPSPSPFRLDSLASGVIRHNTFVMSGTGPVEGERPIMPDLNPNVIRENNTVVRP